MDSALLDINSKKTWYNEKSLNNSTEKSHKNRVQHHNRCWNINIFIWNENKATIHSLGVSKWTKFHKSWSFTKYFQKTDCVFHTLYRTDHSHFFVNRRHRIIMHHDNASTRTTRQTIDWLKEKNIELMFHCAYSPDLAHNDFFVFPNVKQKLCRRWFSSH